jgi:hypothetical protein
MSRSSPYCLLLALAFAAAAPVVPLPGHAQGNQRAYAPEDLWTLSTAEQTRVISLEYREQSSGRTIPNDQLRFYLDQVRLSRWSFSKVKQDIAKSLGNNGGWNPGPGPGPDPGARTIRCESNDGRIRTCQTPWQGQSRLVKQLSSARCTLGQTWFTSRGQVTVTQGCRAEFAAGMGGPGGSGGQQVTIQCESNDGRLRTCGSNLVGRAQLQRQLSNQRCIENRNFGLRNGSVWVNDGCRGVFLAHTRNGGGQGGDYTVTCSSDRGRYTTCAWDARHGAPRLIQQLSNDSCREGYSWGYAARTGLWVNHGCRARFGTR